jgi:hypothetical protein
VVAPLKAERSLFFIRYIDLLIILVSFVPTAPTSPLQTTMSSLDVASPNLISVRERWDRGDKRVVNLLGTGQQNTAVTGVPVWDFLAKEVDPMLGLKRDSPQKVARFFMPVLPGPHIYIYKTHPRTAPYYHSYTMHYV